jgi:hypothetical protein
MALVLATSGLGTTLLAGQDADAAAQRVAALKQSLQANQARLKQYEWVETTIISLKGEEKARKQQRSYYGADGKLQKTPIGEAPEAKPEQSGGRRGSGRVKAKVVENKKDEMQEYMERAAALIHQYVPPNPAQIQKVKDAGKLGVKPLDQGRVRLELAEYLQPGDRLAIDVNGATNSLAAVALSTYLDKPEDAVQLDVKYASLPDGTNYAAQTTLVVKAKNITVVVENSGYRPLAR